MTSDTWVFPALVVLAASAVAGVTDATRFKVYNKLTFPLAAAGLVYHSWTEGWDGFTLSVAGLGVGLALLFIPYQLGALGAGDVKFFAAISAWLGLAPMFTIITAACIATGVYSFVILTRREGLLGVGRNLYHSFAEVATLGLRAPAKPSVQEVLANSPDRRQRLVPFSAMIGVGVLAAVVKQVLAVS